MSKFNWKNIFITILFIGLAIFGVSVLTSENKASEPKEEENKPEPIVEEKKLKIIDEDSKTRPIAIMINNHHSAWPQSGLQDAYLVYEIVAEGGITRMLAIYKDATTEKIGSIRSSRHYYLDYALENDAIYVHFGWSPQAQQDIKTLGINNINGMADAGFWRDKNLKRASEHTAFTSIEKLNEVIKKKGYRDESSRDTLLDYSIDEIDLSTMEGAIKADDITIKYSTYHTTSYKYDSKNKVYLRSMSGKENIDLVTGKQYTVKNIITYKLKNYSLGDAKGRQELENIGKGEGYYITDGYAVPITWEKTSRSAQTVYRYKNGKEIKVNDGNTYIQIQPINQKLDIK